MTRYRFIGTLITKSPLTIQSAQKTTLRRKKKNEAGGDFTETLVDCLPDGFNDFHTNFPLMNNIPVIPATSLKGALRWHLTKMTTHDCVDLDPKLLSLMAVGGVLQKGESKASPAQKKNLKGLVCQDLFGASVPFMRGSFLQFGNAFPTDPCVKLTTMPVIRNAVYNNDTLYERGNKELMDEMWAKDIAEAKNKKDAKSKKKEGELVEETKHVQSAQLQQILGFAKGEEFSHFIDMDVVDDMDIVGGSPFAIFLACLKNFGVEGFRVGGCGAQGFGGHLAYSYDVKRLDGGEWKSIGTIAYDDDFSVSGELANHLKTVDISEHIKITKQWKPFEPTKKETAK